MGARGNSGVILSQLFRGFCKNIEDVAALAASLATVKIVPSTGFMTAL
jgi:dihydroxyacetone kinase-like predicted kinase